MSDIFENKLCYFCDETYPYPSCFIENRNGVYICDNCDDFTLNINFNNTEQGECSICYENKSLLKLPTCIHRLCLECCKTIYFGSTNIQRPIHWTEITPGCPIWPYEITEENEVEEDRKQEEYYYFDNLHFNIETNTYDELIIIRNRLIPERPEWMNTEIFINYENNCFRYHTEFVRLEKEWEEYNENKTRGNGKCPICRINPL